MPFSFGNRNGRPVSSGLNRLLTEKAGQIEQTRTMQSLKQTRTWGRMLEGVEKASDRSNLAVLLENADREPFHYHDNGTYNANMNSMYSGSRLAGKRVNEATTSLGTSAMGVSPQVSVFRNYLLPVIRRMYPQLITKNLVGVQAMSGPVGQIFYLKQEYQGVVNATDFTSTNKGNNTIGTEYGNFIGDTWRVDPNYSYQQIVRETLSTGGGTIGAGIAAGGTGVHIAVNGALPVFNNTGKIGLLVGTAATYAGSMVAGQSLVLVEVTGFVNGSAPAALTATVLAQLNGAAALTNAFTGYITTTTPHTFSLTFGAGAYTNVLSSAEVANAIAAGVTYNGINTVSYDVNFEGRVEQPEIGVNISTATVEAKLRTLRAQWTMLFAQDAKSMHSIEAAEEFASLLSGHIAVEIDREIINNLTTNAGQRVEYNYQHPGLVGGFAVGGTGASLYRYSQVGSLPGAGGAPWAPVFGSGNFDDRNKALVAEIHELSASIFRQSLRGYATWMITSPRIAAKIKSMQDFRVASSDKVETQGGLVEEGTMSNGMKIFTDPLYTENLMLLGYKGSSDMDTGYFYCPYVPVQLSQPIADPRNMNQVQYIMSRYGQFMPENGPRMYGVIKVSNLDGIGHTVPAGFPLTLSPTLSGDALKQPVTDLI